MPKFCTKCGTKLEEGMTTCPNCGAPIKIKSQPKNSGMPKTSKPKTAGEEAKDEAPTPKGEDQTSYNSYNRSRKFVNVAIWVAGSGTILGIVINMIISYIFFKNFRAMFTYPGNGYYAGFIVSIVCGIATFVLLILGIVFIIKDKGPKKRIISLCYGGVSILLTGILALSIYNTKLPLDYYELGDNKISVYLPYSRKNEYKNKIVIPEEINGKTVTEISYIDYNDLVKVIIIPNTVESISDYAFSDDVNLEKIYIPESVDYIGSDIFNYCGSKLEIYCESSEPRLRWNSYNWNIEKNYYYSDDDTKYLIHWSQSPNIVENW